MSGKLAYDDDFNAWTQEQARLLREAARERINTPLDYENLAEEIESMGKSDSRKVLGLVARIVEHLLKLEFSPARDPRGGWRKSVKVHRNKVNDVLRDSPSLSAKLDLGAAFARGRDYAVDGLGEDYVEPDALPADCPYTLDQILDHDWWPANRHGLD